MNGQVAWAYQDLFNVSFLDDHLVPTVQPKTLLDFTAMYMSTSTSNVTVVDPTTTTRR